MHWEFDQIFIMGFLCFVCFLLGRVSADKGI